MYRQTFGRFEVVLFFINLMPAALHVADP